MNKNDLNFCAKVFFSPDTVLLQFEELFGAFLCCLSSNLSLFLSSSFSVYELYSWKKNLAHNVVKNALYLTKVSRDGPNHLSNCFFATLTHCYKIIFLVRFFLFRFVLKKVELELYCFLDNNTGYRKRLNFRAKNVSTYFEQENKCSISVFTTIKLQEKRDNSPVTQVPQWCPNRSWGTFLVGQFLLG